MIPQFDFSGLSSVTESIHLLCQRNNSLPGFIIYTRSTLDMPMVLCSACKKICWSSNKSSLDHCNAICGTWLASSSSTTEGTTAYRAGTPLLPLPLPMLISSEYIVTSGRLLHWVTHIAQIGCQTN